MDVDGNRLILAAAALPVTSLVVGIALTQFWRPAVYVAWAFGIFSMAAIGLVLFARDDDG